LYPWRKYPNCPNWQGPHNRWEVSGQCYDKTSPRKKYLKKNLYQKKRTISTKKFEKVMAKKHPGKVNLKGSFEKSVVIKDCHQTLPKVLLKRWLSLKTVKFC